MSSTSFSKVGNNTLFGTSNQQYGTAWVHDNIRPEKLNIRDAKIPLYSEVVDSLADFKKTQRLIKNRVMQERYGVPLSERTIQQKSQQLNPHFNINNNSFNNSRRSSFTKQFPVQQNTQYRYPSPGIGIGNNIYRTDNMNYGSSLPRQAEMPNKFIPYDNKFTRGFLGGNYKFDGLNTVKSVSKVHNELNDI